MADSNKYQNLFNIRGMAEEPFDGHAASELTLADLDSTTDR